MTYVCLQGSRDFLSDTISFGIATSLVHKIKVVEWTIIRFVISATICFTHTPSSSWRTKWLTLNAEEWDGAREEWKRMFKFILIGMSNIRTPYLYSHTASPLSHCHRKKEENEKKSRHTAKGINKVVHSENSCSINFKLKRFFHLVLSRSFDVCLPQNSSHLESMSGMSRLPGWYQRHLDRLFNTISCLAIPSNRSLPLL